MRNELETLNGILASGINRTLVDMPAWQHIGASAWAAFSQWADLGTNGMILYPLEGIGGVVLIIAAAIIFYTNRRRIPRSEAVPIYARGRRSSTPTNSGQEFHEPSPRRLAGLPMGTASKRSWMTVVAPRKPGSMERCAYAMARN